MSKSKWNCPVAICTYNRPNYLDRCLEYLFRSSDIIKDEVPVYVFCDGGIESTQEKNSEVIKKYPCVSEMFYQSENLCIARHMHHIRDVVFNRMNSDRLMFLEDDILVSPHYYTFFNRILDCYEVIDPTVGAVNSCLLNLDDPQYKLIAQSFFSDALAHINNFIMKKEVWKKIKPTMEEYLEKFVIPVSSYKDIDHEAVMKWAKDKLSSSDYSLTRDERTWAELTSSQDSITNVAMRINNFRYMSSHVNRGINIGREGFHFTFEDYDKIGFGEVTLDIIPNDSDEITSIWDTREAVGYNIIYSSDGKISYSKVIFKDTYKNYHVIPRKKSEQQFENLHKL